MVLNIKLVLSSLFLCILATIYVELHKEPKVVTYSQIQYKEIPLEIERKVFYLYKDLQKYNHLDDLTKIKISKNVVKYAEKYGISYKLLYSVLWRETRFRHNTLHKPTYIKSLNKTIQAKGIGGVVCEYWCETLIKNNIITHENELLELERGIESSAFILKFYKNLGKQEGYTLEESMLNRYYGKPVKKYYKTILNKKQSLENQILALK